MLARLALALCLLPGPLLAHPHIFVDVSFELIFDRQGRLATIRTFWLYDAFYALAITEERGADVDGDGELSAREMQPLQGFDSVWGEGSEGDLNVTQAKAPIALGPARDWKAVWRDGRLGSYHSRDLNPPLVMSDGPAYIQPYDKTFYFAYEVAGPVIFSGRSDCRTKLFLPNLTEAQRRLAEKLALIGSDAEATGFPEVGADFTQTVWMACW